MKMVLRVKTGRGCNHNIELKKKRKKKKGNDKIVLGKKKKKNWREGKAKEK